MTKFLTYFNMYPISEPEEFLGVAADKDDKNVIVTLRRSTVVVLNIKSQKQTVSWTMLEKLSSNVVYDCVVKKYIGTFSGRFIRYWDETVTDISDSNKIEFDKDVALTVSNKHETYALLTDGTAVNLQEAIRSEVSYTQCMIEPERKNIELNPQMIEGAKIFDSPNGRKYLAFFEHNKNNVELVIFYLDDGTDTRFTLKRDDLNVNIIGHTVMQGKTTPTLLTIWSDKRIFMLELNDDVKPKKSPGNFVSMLLTFNMDKPLSIHAISENFVAIYGSTSGQEGSSLLLYNTRFKVIKTQQFFKVYFKFSRLYALNDYILIAMGPNLAAVKFCMTKEIFSELVASQINNDLKSHLVVEPINEEELLQCNVKIANSKKPNHVSKSFCDEYATDEKLQLLKVSDFYQTADILNQFNTSIELLRDEFEYGNARISVLANDSYIKDIGSSIAAQLERCGISQHEISEKLITAFIKSDRQKDIATTCQRYPNLSEKMLATLLCYVLNDCLQNSSIRDEDGETMDFNSDILKPLCNNGKQLQIYSLLNTIMISNFEYKSLVRHIHCLFESTQIYFMIQYLYSSMMSLHQYTTCKTKHTLPNTPTDLHILHWLTLLLDSHYPILAMSKTKQLRNLLCRWNQVLQDLKREFINLSKAQTLLYKILHGENDKKKSCSKWYSIDEIVLY